MKSIRELEEAAAAYRAKIAAVAAAIDPIGWEIVEESPDDPALAEQGKQLQAQAERAIAAMYGLSGKPEIHPETADPATLVDRLRGIYRIPIRDGLGPAGGDEPNNPNFHVRRMVTGSIQHAAADRIEQLEAELARLRPPPPLLIPGTTVEVHRIVALLDRMSVEEVLEDYPGLTGAQIDQARTLAAANPHQGVPFPTITAKKAIRDAFGEE